jgi:uncharacterized protein YjbJ (UPF0337 family)
MVWVQRRDTGMSALKGTADKAIGKTKEAVAEIIGDGALREEGKQQQRKGEAAKDDAKSDADPLGPLNRLT